MMSNLREERENKKIERKNKEREQRENKQIERKNRESEHREREQRENKQIEREREQREREQRENKQIEREREQREREQREREQREREQREREQREREQRERERKENKQTERGYKESEQRLINMNNNTKIINIINTENTRSNSNSNKIAIYTGVGFHLECVGFLCELFTNNKYINKSYDIDIYYKDDHFMYLNYYTRLYKINKIEKFDKFNNMDEYFLVIKITSHDYEKIIQHNNIISIVHRIDLLDLKSKNFSLTPLINEQNDERKCNYNDRNLKNKINYIFPYYNGEETAINFNTNNTIVYVGYFEREYYDDDLKNFINKLPQYNFIFIYSNNNNPFIGLKNVTRINSCSTANLINYVKNSKFMLMRKLPYQGKGLFSGALSIAVSMKKPIILQKFFADIYDLPAITFENNYCETIDYLSNITEERYNKCINELKNKIDIINDYNKEIISKLI